MNKSVYCIICGTENTSDSRFCIKCGTKLEISLDEPAKEEKQDIPVIIASDETIVSTAEHKKETSSADNLFADPAPAFPSSDDSTAAEDEMPTFTDIEAPRASDVSAPAFAEAEDGVVSSVINKISQLTATADSTDKTIDGSNAQPFSAAFEAVGEEKEAEPVITENPKKEKNVYDEDDFAFASGLPGWSLEPPQVMVRRRKG